jgi:hypothetical protein
LTIQKQPGLRPVPVTASITLPQGAQVNSVSDGTTVANGVATFTATLTQDTQVRITYRLP